MKDIKRINIKEFRAKGYLQEVNRRCLHPVGMALEATVVDPEGWAPDNRMVVRMAEGLIDQGVCDNRDDATSMAVAAMNALYPVGSQHLSGVWDYRDDPEGMLFDPPMLDQECIDHWDALLASKVEARKAMESEPGVKFVDNIQVPA